MTGREKEEHAENDRDVRERLEGRVPRQVPDEVAAAIRSAIVTELAVAPTDSASADRGARMIGRRVPSLGITTAVALVVCVGLNGFVALRSTHRVATLLGDQQTQSAPKTTFLGTKQLAGKRIDTAAIFEFNASLIQQELNYERIESHRASNRRRTTIAPPEEDPLDATEKNSHRSGAATRSGSGIQRRARLAGEFTA